MIGLMVLSSLAFVMEYYANPDSGISYGDFKFTSDPLGYKTKIDGKDIVFTYLPDSLDSVNVSSAAPYVLRQSRAVLISIDPDTEYSDTLGTLQYMDSNILTDALGIMVGPGLTNNTAYPDIPQIDCLNASSDEPVLLMRYTNDSSDAGVSTQGNCVILKAQYSDDFTRYNDRLMYEVVGVMK